jgi:hypothetical protein
VERLGCAADFDAMASDPLDASIPGARSEKVVFDRIDDSLYFQNSVMYRTHFDFASAHCSVANGRPYVGSLAEFNLREYTGIDRRFILGAVTYYEQPDLWMLELAPYDTASAGMIEMLFDAIRAQAFFGAELAFHPTSVAGEAVAADLRQTILIKTTDDIFAETDYQPLNLGTSVGRLRFVEADNLDTEYLWFRDTVVLDHVPNDISVVAGLITEEFQTPLSHVNVLSQNRGTPNMGLRHATTNETLRDLNGKWVQLSVGPFEWTIEEVSEEEADAWAETHAPEPLDVPPYDLSERGISDIEEIVAYGSDAEMRAAISAAVPAFGGKASHYSVLKRIDPEKVVVPTALAVPIYYYDQFLRENRFDVRIQELLDDATFQNSPEERDLQLEGLRDDMITGAVNEEFQDLLRTRLAETFSDIDNIRFRSSTNAEDLGTFTGAGLYTSATGCQSNWPSVLNAIREVWASVWYFRSFEERSYNGIDHLSVGMALLVHHSFPSEEANGVALTANPFDTEGIEPAFYVNVQVGDESVVKPLAGVTTDQYLHFFMMQGQPVTYLSSSSRVPAGEHVLSAAQIHQLGVALDAIHMGFFPAYGPAPGTNRWYAMDVEFKFDDEWVDSPEGESVLQVKQARPHPGRGK